MSDTYPVPASSGTNSNAGFNAPSGSAECSAPMCATQFDSKITPGGSTIQWLPCESFQFDWTLHNTNIFPTGGRATLDWTNNDNGDNFTYAEASTHGSATEWSLFPQPDLSVAADTPIPTRSWCMKQGIWRFQWSITIHNMDTVAGISGIDLYVRSRKRKADGTIAMGKEERLFHLYSSADFTVDVPISYDNNMNLLIECFWVGWLRVNIGYNVGGGEGDLMASAQVKGDRLRA